MDSFTHWKKLQNPDYLGAYALNPGEEIIATIKSVKNENVIGTDGKTENCTVARFIEPIKPMILNVTNCKIISKLYKTPYIENWAGKKIQIYATKVKAFGEIVEALRIRPEIPKTVVNDKIMCSNCNHEITAFGGKSPTQLAEYTQEKYSKALCSVCAKQEADKLKAINVFESECEGKELDGLPNNIESEKAGELQEGILNENDQN